MPEQPSNPPEQPYSGPELIGEILRRHGGLPEIDEDAEAARQLETEKLEAARRLNSLIELYQSQQALRQSGVTTDPAEDASVEEALGQALQDAERLGISIDDQGEA